MQPDRRNALMKKAADRIAKSILPAPKTHPLPSAPAKAPATSSRQTTESMPIVSRASALQKPKMKDVVADKRQHLDGTVRAPSGKLWVYSGDTTTSPQRHRRSAHLQAYSPDSGQSVVVDVASIDFDPFDLESISDVLDGTAYGAAAPAFLQDSSLLDAFLLDPSLLGTSALDLPSLSTSSSDTIMLPYGHDDDSYDESLLTQFVQGDRASSVRDYVHSNLWTSAHSSPSPTSTSDARSALVYPPGDASHLTSDTSSSVPRVHESSPAFLPATHLTTRTYDAASSDASNDSVGTESMPASSMASSSTNELDCKDGVCKLPAAYGGLMRAAMYEPRSFVKPIRRHRTRDWRTGEWIYD
jgi:hypothetical protein